MNNKALTLSLVMAVLAVFFVQSYVESIEEESKKRYGREGLVLVASEDIKEMESISQGKFDWKVFPDPKKYAGETAIYVMPADPKNPSKLDIERQGERTKQLIGSIALVPIKKGEPITYSKLSAPSIRTGLSSQITPGKRAISIDISDRSGVAKLVKPGDRVDLISIVDFGGGKENKVARTLLQDVVVLATGKSITNNAARTVEYEGAEKPKIRNLVEDSNFSTVTLEVEPYQAQTMSMLMASGDNSLFITLRNNDDTDRVNVPPTALMDVFGAEAARLGRIPAGNRR